MTIPDSDDPISLFNTWFAEADAAEHSLATACCLATADARGIPSARMVLLKDADAEGFVFYTNLESRKGHELLGNPNAALCFHWKSLQRQVRVEGAVEPLSDGEADVYFASRPRGAQIGAWASKQSRALEGRFELEKRIAQYSAKFHIGTVPRPEFWTGFRIKPKAIEFWEEQLFRLHDRLVFIQAETGWTTERLFP
jgi:pyridoxamine 5'-phosphate oxidase